MTKIRKAADTYEKEANSNKVRSDTSKAYQVRNHSNKEKGRKKKKKLESERHFSLQSCFLLSPTASAEL